MSQAERRLAAIMFTDMVGYTSLSQADEEAAMTLLEEQRALLRPILARHGGREVKTIGDGFLVEFSSSLEAVRCALDIQHRIAERNAGGQSQKLSVRIGIHAGEVIHNLGDVYGDAVNIAARIEPLAEAGGICISQQVYDLIANKVDVQVARMGQVALKNVKAPMEIYKVTSRAGSMGMVTKGSLKKRVAVLPFDNFSPDSGDEYFADGLTEELIGTLSKIRELSVISRTSVMQYKGKPKQISEIGRELNAGTILEGSVRKAGNRARVSVQMVDATEDRHVWAESYDRDLQDIFSVQSDIAGKVADALKVELLAAEKEVIEAPPTKSPEANLLFLKGIHHGDSGSPSDLLKAIEYFELAVDEDPQFALAHAAAAAYYVGVAGEGLAAEPAFAKAKEHLSRAMMLNPRLPEAHSAKGWLAFQYDLDSREAEESFKEAIELSPSMAPAHDWYGRMLACLGRFEEAIEEMGRAYELDPVSHWVKLRFAIVYWMAGKNSQARVMFDKAIEASPKFARAFVCRAMLEATEGRSEEAKGDVDLAVSIADDAFFRTFQAMVHASVGSRVKAGQILENILAGRYPGYASPALIGSVYYHLGDTTKGYEWLDKARKEHDPFIPWSNKWPILEVERKDPRVVEMLRRMNLP